MSFVSPSYILQAGGSLDANVTLANFLQADTRHYFYYEVVLTFIFILIILLILITLIIIKNHFKKIKIITAVERGSFHYPERYQYKMNTILLFIAIVIIINCSFCEGKSDNATMQ